VKIVLEKLKDAVLAVLPITVIVVAINFLFEPMPTADFVTFLISAAILIVGMALYSLGSDVAMTSIGMHIGTELTKTKKMWLILLLSFVICFIVTIAEPDLAVLATQVGEAAIPRAVLLVTISFGVGIFLVLSMLRVFLKVSLNIMLLVFYALLFGCAVVVEAVAPEFLALAFDSGGVTTGPITVPFIMALGIGVAANLGADNSRSNSFGTIALCSIGPILMVLLLGIFYRPDMVVTTAATAHFGAYFGEVALSLAPIVLFFFIFQFCTTKVTKHQLIRIVSGLVYTYLGLVLFLAAANIGFVPAGRYIGGVIAGSKTRFLLIPVGMLVGGCIVLAEPAVHVLNKQVESITDGYIKRRTMLLVLSVSVATSIGLAMVRVLTGLSIWWMLVPGYAVALGLSFFVPQLFTGIGFDSGGVASGPMTTTFLLPFALGACAALGGNQFRDAFGVVAFVAMTPLIALQVFGLVYKIKLGKAQDISDDIARQLATEGDEIIILSEGKWKS
jgi:hypothetical protein